MDIPPLGSSFFHPSKKIEDEEPTISKVSELGHKISTPKKETDPIKGPVTKEAPSKKSIPLQKIVNSEELPKLNEHQIRLKLVEKKILPTIEEAKEAYWSLGKNWWEQIIDGWCHQFGESVFDEGHHGGHKEPGYLAGIKAGSEYFMHHLGEQLTTQLYLGIHHEACAHFKKGKTNGIMCDPHEIDLFRRENASTRTGTKEHYQFLTNGKKLVKAFITNRALPNEKDEKIEVFLSKINQLYAETFVDYDSLLHFVDKMIDAQCPVSTESTLNAAVHETFSRLNHGYFIKFKNDKHLPTINVSYKGTSANKSEFITEDLLDEFNDHIAKAQKECYQKVIQTDDPEELLKIKSAYQTTSIYFIARLFQELEWAHPWIDGQGRTDLILLNGLLCREGLHPCILYHPYFSTFNILEDWIDYLKDGLAAFQTKKDQLNL